MRFALLSLLLSPLALISSISASPVDSVISHELVARGSSEDSILAAHNNARRRCGVRALKWDTRLARMAQNYANRCRTNPLVHSGNGAENLAANSNGNLYNMVDQQWVAEERYYDYNRPGFSSRTGHFTQVVWASTTNVGCGWAQCGRMRLLVCNYYPAGNVQGGNNFRNNVKRMGGSRTRSIDSVAQNGHHTINMAIAAADVNGPNTTTTEGSNEEFQEEEFPVLEKKSEVSTDVVKRSKHLHHMVRRHSVALS